MTHTRTLHTTLTRRYYNLRKWNDVSVSCQYTEHAFNLKSRCCMAYNVSFHAIFMKGYFSHCINNI